MNYANVKTFCEFLAPRDAEVVELTARRDQLARTLDDRKLTNAIAKKKSQIRPIEGMTKQLQLVERKLNEAIERRRAIINLRLKTWALVRILQEAEGTLWTSEEIQLWYKHLGRNEGPGEAALRLRLGIETDATYKPGDLVKQVDDQVVIYREVKSVDVVTNLADHGSRETIQSIQTGSQGRHSFGRWMWSLTDEQKMNIDPALADKVAIGEITQDRITKLSSTLLASLRAACAPSKSMGGYEGVYATTRHGFIFIPQVDCDRAWELDSITKMGPKYVLSDDYLRDRIRATAMAPNIEWLETKVA